MIQHTYLLLKEIISSFASKYIVCTESLSCLQTLQSMKLEHSLIRMVIQKCVFLNFDNKVIIVCWVSSHTYIGCNTKVDSAAKSALTLPHATVVVCFIHFKHCISQYILSTWQCGWNDVVANKLHSVTTVLGDWLSSYRRKLFYVVPATVILI